MASLEAARRSLDAAARAEAGRYAGVEYNQAAEYLLLGRMEMARQSGRLPFFRDFSTTDSLLTLASKTAEVAFENARSRFQDQRDRSVGDRDLLQEELRSWREAVEGSLLKNRSRPYLERAELNLFVGQQLMNKGEFTESMPFFTEGRRSLADLGCMAEDQAEEESKKVDTWRKWVSDTVERSRSGNSRAIIIDKATHTLHLIDGGKLVHTYRCDLGYYPGRQKLLAGDGATPEGKYRITTVKDRGSKYYKALLLDYPNNLDRERYRENRAKGIISPNAHIGAFIEIHGEGGMNRDWTNGCIALANRDMDHLIQHVSVGTPVTIVRKSDRWP